MRNCSKLFASLFKGRSVAYESSIDGPAQQSRLSAHFSPNIFLHGWLSLRLHKDIYQKYKYKYTSMFLPKPKKLFILVTHLRWWDVLVTWNWDNNRKHFFVVCFFPFIMVVKSLWSLSRHHQHHSCIQPKPGNPPTQCKPLQTWDQFHRQRSCCPQGHHHHCYHHLSRHFQHPLHGVPTLKRGG